MLPGTPDACTTNFSATVLHWVFGHFGLANHAPWGCSAPLSPQLSNYPIRAYSIKLFRGTAELFNSQKAPFRFYRVDMNISSQCSSALALAAATETIGHSPVVAALEHGAGLRRRLSCQRRRRSRSNELLRAILNKDLQYQSSHLGRQTWRTAYPYITGQSSSDAPACWRAFVDLPNLMAI